MVFECKVLEFDDLKQSSTKLASEKWDKLSSASVYNVLVLINAIIWHKIISWKLNLVMMWCSH
jgi:hypothetical protein